MTYVNRTGVQNIKLVKFDLASEVMMISKGKGRSRCSSVIEVVFPNIIYFQIINFLDLCERHFKIFQFILLNFLL